MSWCGNTPQSAAFTGEASADNCPVLHCCFKRSIETHDETPFQQNQQILLLCVVILCCSVLRVILKSYVQSFRAWPLLLLPKLVNMKLASWTGQSFERMKRNSKTDLGRTEASSEQICLKSIVSCFIVSTSADQGTNLLVVQSLVRQDGFCALATIPAISSCHFHH